MPLAMALVSHTIICTAASRMKRSDASPRPDRERQNSGAGGQRELLEV